VQIDVEEASEDEVFLNTNDAATGNKIHSYYPKDIFELCTTEKRDNIRSAYCETLLCMLFLVKP
jgi:hypothetical protein